LPADFPLPLAVALHRHRESDGLLAPLLQKSCVLPVGEVDDKEPIVAGRVYVCPADYHLLIDDGCFSLSTDDLVNFARPAIDVLFESAAEWHGPATVAVILSGAGFDGAAGARRVRERGGLVLVQKPDTAESPWMPAAAISATQTRHVLTLERIAAVLVRLARRRRPSFGR
jgi:two-component system chemotaxis response regulator CheB